MLCIPYPVSPKGSILQNYSKYHNQRIDTDGRNTEHVNHHDDPLSIQPQPLSSQIHAFFNHCCYSVAKSVSDSVNSWTWL